MREQIVNGDKFCTHRHHPSHKNVIATIFLDKDGSIGKPVDKDAVMNMFENYSVGAK